MIGVTPGRAAGFAALIQKYPGTKFSVIVDHPAVVTALDEVLTKARLTAEVLADINIGQDRTGISLAELPKLYSQIAKTSSLKVGGFHAYDGHNNMEAAADREASVLAKLKESEEG